MEEEEHALANQSSIAKQYRSSINGSTLIMIEPPITSTTTESKQSHTLHSDDTPKSHNDKVSEDLLPTSDTDLPQTDYNTIKVHIINLKRSKDRYHTMKDKINTLLESYPHLHKVLEFEFFEAIDGKALEHRHFAKHHSRRLCLWLRGKELSDGELACFASHYVLWQRCVQSSKPCIVIEDDVCFSEHFAQGVQEIIHSNYEYVRFMQLRPLKSYKPTKAPHIISTTQLCAGTQGYYLTPNAAHKFLARAGKWVFPVDDYMDMFYIHKVWILVCMPPLLRTHEELATNITDRNTAKLSSLQKIAREASRLGLQIYKHFFCLLHYKSLRKL
ncbi:glycosyltransferase family 25 protein [uncultured Helicobacter sp.]|uniref:glycosyltransferase family 25 protein n=1 Tax=uncultured Helicobacter sp. TaxID=175537 RepID=UPI00374EB415